MCTSTSTTSPHELTPTPPAANPVNDSQTRAPRVTTDKRECVMCSKKLVGRSDKVFCDYHCKNDYHAQNRVTTRTLTGETIRILQKNYLILAGLLTDKTNGRIRQTALTTDGFEPMYATGIQPCKKGFAMQLFDLCFRIRGSDIEFWKTKVETHFSPYTFERWRRAVGGPTIARV